MGSQFAQRRFEIGYLNPQLLKLGFELALCITSLAAQQRKRTPA
jgi:hypothetical protein